MTSLPRPSPRQRSRKDVDAKIVNVGGGSSVSMLELISLIGQITGRKVPLAMEAPRAGDVEATRADTATAVDSGA